MSRQCVNKSLRGHSHLTSSVWLSFFCFFGPVLVGYESHRFREATRGGDSRIEPSRHPVEFFSGDTEGGQKKPGKRKIITGRDEHRAPSTTFVDDPKSTDRKIIQHKMRRHCRCSWRHYRQTFGIECAMNVVSIKVTLAQDRPIPSRLDVHQELEALRTWTI